jgi:Flp pilus assembly protein TadD
MLQRRTDRINRIRSSIALLILMALTGCATTENPSSNAGRTDHSDESRETSTLITVDDHGFTVSETVKIGSDVRNDYQQASILLQQGRLADGIELLKSVTERAPGVTIPHIDLGVAYGRIDNNPQAEESLRTALSLSPNHPVALNEMGIVLRRTGKFDGARNHYERALAVHPYYHFALHNLGVLCDLYLNDLQCALEHYERYAEMVTDDNQVTIWIADIRNRLGIITE